MSGGGRVVGARYFPVYFEMNTDIVDDGRKKTPFISLPYLDMGTHTHARMQHHHTHIEHRQDPIEAVSCPVKVGRPPRQPTRQSPKGVWLIRKWSSW